MRTPIIDNEDTPPLCEVRGELTAAGARIICERIERAAFAFAHATRDSRAGAGQPFAEAAAKAYETVRQEIAVAEALGLLSWIQAGWLTGDLQLIRDNSAELCPRGWVARQVFRRPAAGKNCP